MPPRTPSRPSAWASGWARPAWRATCGSPRTTFPSSTTTVGWSGGCAACPSRRCPGRRCPPTCRPWPSCTPSAEPASSSRLDAKDQRAAEAVVAVARAAGDGASGNGALGRLWICHPDWHLLARWRTDPDFEGVRLVNSTRRKEMRQGPERRAAQLSEARYRCGQPPLQRLDGWPDHPVPPLRPVHLRLGRPARAHHPGPGADGHRRHLQRPRRPPGRRRRSSR